MNRLIIIGNGFDLAHGLKTGYCDFISNYWSKVKSSFYSDEFIEFKQNNSLGLAFDNCTSLKHLIEKIKSDGFEIRNDNQNSISFTDGFSIEFKNKFFKVINDRHQITNWVDIEMEYYELVKSILGMKQALSRREGRRFQLNAITELNRNIQAVTDLFEKYLQEKVSRYTYQRKFPDMLEILGNKVIGLTNSDYVKTEFAKKYRKQMFPPNGEPVISLGSGTKKFDETYVLNFNYTNTVNNYFTNDAVVINIHGELGFPQNNKIILGFGDEKDKFYAELEDLNENEYLRFMKSFHYVQNDNHKRLIDFIESGLFQVQLMGHSCGLSDRTLLNAIFENPNCISIKSFFYQYNQKNEYGEEDNFLELNKNISRHFSDKKVMRDKIVNKNYCQPLPQNNTLYEII